MTPEISRAFDEFFCFFKACPGEVCVFVRGVCVCVRVVQIALTRHTKHGRTEDDGARGANSYCCCCCCPLQNPGSGVSFIPAKSSLDGNAPARKCIVSHACA